MDIRVAEENGVLNTGSQYWLPLLHQNKERSKNAIAVFFSLQGIRVFL
jgi:hypothetical protein